MRHRSVSIELKYTKMIMKEVKNKCMPLLIAGCTDASKKIIIYYSNMREKIINMTKQLELFLNIDDKLYLTDAISIHGQLPHEEKVVYLKMFMGDKLPFKSADICIILVMSGVANAGINSSEIYTAIRIEFPPSIMDICQEKGCVGCVPSPSPEVYSYMICFDIDSFVLLLKRILNPEQTMSTEYRRSMINDHIAVAKLFCSVHCCFNKVFETTLAKPSVRIDPDTVGERHRCKICPGCRGEIADMYNPIFIKGSQEILFSAVTKKPQYMVKEFVDYIWDVPAHFSSVLFRRNRQRQNVRKCKLQLFMFQLIAWDMLIPMFDKDTKQITFRASVLSNESVMYTFQIKKSWDKVHSLVVNDK